MVPEGISNLNAKEAMRSKENIQNGMEKALISKVSHPPVTSTLWAAPLATVAAIGAVLEQFKRDWMFDVSNDGSRNVHILCVRRRVAVYQHDVDHGMTGLHLGEASAGKCIKFTPRTTLRSSDSSRNHISYVGGSSPRY